jgi:hypothetical protein
MSLLQWMPPVRTLLPLLMSMTLLPKGRLVSPAKRSIGDVCPRSAWPPSNAVAKMENENARRKYAATFRHTGGV